MPGKCAGYRPGIPQQPYTKWDTDKDEIEVDYKQLDDKRQSWFAGRKGCALKVLLVLVVFSVGLIIGYVVRRSVHETTPCKNGSCPYMDEHKDYSLPLSEKLKKFVDAESIEENLRNYTEKIHLTGTKDNNKLGNLLRSQFQQLGIKVKDSVYKALLSYPDLEYPNVVILLNNNGTEMYKTSYKGPQPEYHYERTPYNAYSPNGTVQGDIIYANFGEEQDFLELERQHINCSGQIVIMRYGKIYRGQKVRNAEKWGAAGVILYSDPAEVTAQHTMPGDLFPNSWWLPDWAVQRGAVRASLTGDPLTPGLPSVEGMYRIPLSEADLPKIPVHTVSYAEAHEILMSMGGPAGPHQFFGSMHENVTYYMGPGYEGLREGWKVRLEVNTETEERPITNIFGIIPGTEEPDRYVIIGSHYDAWTFGGIDPNSGTAVLMELAKAFVQLQKSGWQPKRTIMFAHWDGEEQGLIGSYEWVEQNAQVLMHNTVAYINLDGAVRGNHTLRVQATPLFRSIVMDSSRRVSSIVTGDDKMSSLYDQWKARSTNADNKEPRINDISGDSDQAPFVFRLGVPVLFPQFWFDNTYMSDNSYPGYHTAIDNFTLVTMVDPGFRAHVALTQLVADVALKLVSSAQLPFDCREYAVSLGDYFNVLQSTIASVRHYPVNRLDYLHWAIGNFSEICETFYHDYYSMAVSDALKVKQINERLLQLSRAFINSDAFPDQPYFKNILFAPSSSDQSKSSTFAPIMDAVMRCSQEHESKKKEILMREVDRQVSIATLSVMTAGNILQDSIIT